MKLRLAISGSAGTGKTTLARELSHRLNLPLIPEAMRAYLEAGGKRLDRVAQAQAEMKLAEFRAELEAAEGRLGAFVTDNGALDLDAYAHWYGCAGASKTGAHAGRYDAVVILPAGILPYERDGIRQEDPAQEAQFQKLLERLAEESELESVLLRVPTQLRTVEERAEWVLEQFKRFTTKGTKEEKKNRYKDHRKDAEKPEWMVN